MGDLTATGSPPDSAQQAACDGRVSRDAAWLVAGRVLAKLLSFAFMMVLARALGQAGVGNYSYAISLLLVASAVVCSGADMVCVRHLTSSGADSLTNLGQALAVKAVLCAAGSAALLLVAWLSAGAQAAGPCLLIVVPLFILGGFNSTAEAILLSRHRASAVAVAEAINRGGGAIVGIGAIKAGLGLGGALGGLVAGSLGALAWYAALVGLEPVRLAYRSLGAIRSQAVVEIIGVGGANAGFALLGRLDSLVLWGLCGAAAAGPYGAACTLVNTVCDVVRAARNAALPAMGQARDSSQASRAVLRQALAVALLLSLPVAVLLIAFARPILGLLYGEAFAASAQALRILACYAVVWALSGVVQYHLIANGRESIIVRILAVGVVGGLALALWLVPRYQAEGAAIALLAGNGLVLALGTLAARSRSTGRLS